ncbi:type IV toxin-antitoxin system AbiEi family antitoxin domain-containing protein [Bounagaea algeriensis]
MKALAALTALGDEYTPGQWGMVTTSQARQLGVETVTLTRLVEQGLLLRLRHGVYAVAAAEEADHADLKAAWLALNPKVAAWRRPMLDPDGGVVSHRSATLLHELGDLAADKIEVSVPRRRTMRDPAVRLRVRALEPGDVILVEGLPVTTIERTVVDLLEDHVDASHVAPIIHEASLDGRLDLDSLAARIGGYSRRYGLATGDGRGLLDHLLAQVSDASPSERALVEILQSYPEVYDDLQRRLSRSAMHTSRNSTQQVLPNLTKARMAPVRRAIAAAGRSHQQYSRRTARPDRRHSARSPKDASQHRPSPRSTARTHAESR